jgi:hypothetical protein
MSEDAAAPRWRGEPGFFEIWFVVAFDRETRRAGWFRYTTFAPRDGVARATVWAAVFEAGRAAEWGKRVVPLDEVRAAVAELGRGRCAGAVDTEGGPLVWSLALRGGEHVVRGPAWLHRVPTPTRVAHLRAEATAVGTIALGDDRRAPFHGVAAVKHLWGTRRVEELYWVYCPALEAGGAFEATSVRVRAGAGPRVTTVWLASEEGERRWWSLPGVFRHRVEPDGPGRLRVRARSALARVEALATCDPATLAGYVYRDPSGFDVHVAQSDVATCEIVTRTRAHLLAPWGAARRLVGGHAAVEFHHPAPLANVRYIGWDATRPPEVTP